ncbi:MAG: IS3 family transposase [Planctomycetes bacterium]|nr:IS3 family transposase [Planctomycetota bacterium]
MCNIARVSKGGYYKWLRSPKRNKDEKDLTLIKMIFEKGKKKLGMRLMNDHGAIMNHKKIIRIIKENNLVAQVRRKNPYKMIMKVNQEHRTAANILNREFKQIVPRKVFCTDITYLYYGMSQRAYLSAVKDIASNEIVGWKLSNNLSLKFVLDSISHLKSEMSDAIIHSDQGVHYTHPTYITRVKELNLKQSMSRRGNCIDNSPMESFFGHLKDEFECRRAKTFEELNIILDEYLKYYNNERYKWDLKKMTPVQYRNHLLNSN